MGSPLAIPLLLACALLLGYSSIVQTLLLVRSNRPSSPDTPLEVIVTEPIEIDVGPGGLPVEIESVSTLDELRVNLYNHYIIGNDPIPVEIAN